MLDQQVWTLSTILTDGQYTAMLPISERYAYESGMPARAFRELRAYTRYELLETMPVARHATTSDADASEIATLRLVFSYSGGELVAQAPTSSYGLGPAEGATIGDVLKAFDAAADQIESEIGKRQTSGALSR